MEKEISVPVKGNVIPDGYEPVRVINLSCGRSGVSVDMNGVTLMEVRLEIRKTWKPPASAAVGSVFYPNSGDWRVTLDDVKPSSGDVWSTPSFNFSAAKWYSDFVEPPTRRPHRITTEGYEVL